MGKPEQLGWIEALALLGAHLNNGLDLRVLNGGVVVPSAPAVFPSHLGVEKDDGFREATRGSPTGPRPRAPRWQGAPGGSWTPRPGSPIVSVSVQKQYEAELGALGQSYPGAQFWHVDDGVWIRLKSQLLDGLPRHAFFLISVSYTTATVRSWAFWSHELAKPFWIGPRHTNFYDGSICAFEITDKTWCFGQPIVSLLDLYTVWALRHLHLEMFGTWPGAQVSHYGIERIVEQRDDEWCGCGAGKLRYKNCCKGTDILHTEVADAVQFALFPRTPPRSILDLLEGDARLLCMSDID